MCVCACVCVCVWVICIIECEICELQIVGKSETVFNLRLNNHSNHIEKGVSSCDLTEHFLRNTISHNFDSETIINIIERTKEGNPSRNRNILAKKLKLCSQMN